VDPAARADEAIALGSGDRQPIEIRALLLSDAAAFQSLRLRGLAECPTAFASSYEEECERPLAVVAERLAAAPDRVVFGAFGGTELVGVIGLMREGHRKLAHKGLIWGMYVAPEARRQGIGRQLVDAALTHAFANLGARQVNLGVNAANAPAIALYRATGFEPFGLERGFMIVDGVTQDEIHMVCVIDTSRQDQAERSEPAAKELMP
jgi:RimJ/RimL family protein N-acetyltransferase